MFFFGPFAQVANDVVHSGSIVDADINIAANINILKLAAYQFSVVAGNCLDGGGTANLGNSVTVDFNFTGQSAITTLAGANLFLVHDGADNKKITFTNLNTNLDHNVLTNFDTNKHFDHTAISISAGEGIAGGGSIAANRTLALDLPSLAAVASLAGTDVFVIHNGTNHKKITYTDLSTLVGLNINGLTETLTSAVGDFYPLYNGVTNKKITLANLNAELLHDSLDGINANQHIDHTTVDIGTAVGSGLSGGGNISASRALQVVVDNSTIEIATNTIQVKNAGITAAKIASYLTALSVANNVAINWRNAANSADVAVIKLDASDNIVLSQALKVASGGWGLATLTAHALYVGNGASSPTALTVGATGELLIGATGADPAFGTSANGNFTFTSATAGSTRSLTVSNTDNANAASNAASVIAVGGTSGGDAFQRHEIGTARSYAYGPDTSDSQIWKLRTSADATATPSSGTILQQITATGYFRLPLQSAFCALKTSDSTDQTGDGTDVTVIFDDERDDQNSNYDNTTGIYTAPITSNGYVFAFGCRMSNVGAGHTQCNARIFTTNTSFYTNQFSPAAIKDSANRVTYAGTIGPVPMTAGDTAKIIVSANNSTKTVGIDGGGGSGTALTFFTGGIVL